ncbi:actin cortical patch SUR7/pH-response regulator pali [Favolaschia claudopus]|uniref:Actin cortical patch SUR7/pH-response regulator pali n=1 Tax=Favolaschia claudopus TaxID=2862362 RepID=A0AAW0B5M4_9AGAR
MFQLTPFITCVVFLLLLLVSLSTPIIKGIFFLRLSAASSSTLLNSSARNSVTFGVWGYCASGEDIRIFGINHDAAKNCSGRHLGYTFDDTLQTTLGVSGFEGKSVSKALTASLSLHPIAAVLTFILFLISLFILRRNNHVALQSLSLIQFGIGILAAIITTIALLVDCIVVDAARRTISGHIVTVTWGNAVWMTLVAAILLWAVNLEAMTRILTRRQRHDAALR